MQPETRYAKSSEVNIAYQVFGDGPHDLVFAPGFVSNIELGWMVPGRGDFLRALASFARVIQFDKRGTGMSDRVGDLHGACARTLWAPDHPWGPRSRST